MSSDMLTKEQRDEWYLIDEVRQWLERENPALAAHAPFITLHLQAAFVKGQQLANTAREQRVAELEAELVALKAENSRLRQSSHGPDN